MCIKYSKRVGKKIQNKNSASKTKANFNAFLSWAIYSMFLTRVNTFSKTKTMEKKPKIAKIINYNQSKHHSNILQTKASRLIKKMDFYWISILKKIVNCNRSQDFLRFKQNRHILKKVNKI